MCTFSSCCVLGIYMIYNIYKFQEKKRTKNPSLFTFTFSLFTFHFYFTTRALRLPPHGFSTRGGLARFARELVPNGVAYGFPNFGSRALFLLKKSPHPCKNWSFVWKIANRPIICDFEIYNLDPQLHQNFKPIKTFFCTFLPI